MINYLNKIELNNIYYLIYYKRDIIIIYYIKECYKINL